MGRCKHGQNHANCANLKLTYINDRKDHEHLLVQRKNLFLEAFGAVPGQKKPKMCGAYRVHCESEGSFDNISRFTNSGSSRKILKIQQKGNTQIMEALWMLGSQCGVRRKYDQNSEGTYEAVTMSNVSQAPERTF